MQVVINFLGFLACEMQIYFSPLTLNSGAGEEPVKFYINLCFDVILEVLQFGDRRQLIKLQRIGQRFHRIGENFFAEVPFLRLDLMFEFDQMRF